MHMMSALKPSPYPPPLVDKARSFANVYKKLTYCVASALLLIGSASAEPYSDTSLVINAGQESSYDSVTVNWTAGNEDEAGVLLDTGSSLTVSGDFALTAESATASTLGKQQGLLVTENAAYSQTGDNFTLVFTADSTSATDLGAAYFDRGSSATLGANARITATGTAETLWGVRNYGSVKGNSLLITTTNDKTAQDTHSEQGFSVGFWSESHGDITFSNLGITATGAGNRTDGIMIYGSDESKTGLASIDRLTVSASNSGENGRAFGINFYQAQNSNNPVNFEMEGTSLTVKATSDLNDAAGILNTYGDPGDSSITINYGTIDITAKADQSAWGLDLYGNPVNNAGAAASVTASDLLKVNTESTSYTATGILSESASFQTGELDVSAKASKNVVAVDLTNTEWTTAGKAVMSAISETGTARGLDISNSSGETVRFEKEVEVTASSQGEDKSVYGVYLGKGTLEIGGIANISAKSDQGTATAVYATQSGQNITFHDTLNASATGQNEASAAIKAQMESTISASHGGTITSNHLAVHAYRGGHIDLSSDENNVLTIQGDIKAERWLSTYSGVSVDLGAGSSWTGDAEGNGGATVAVTLQDGGYWKGDASETVYNTSSKGKVNVTLQGGTWALAGNQASSTTKVLSEGGTIDISNLSGAAQLTVATLQTTSADTVFYTDTLHNETVAVVTKHTGTDGQVGVVGSAAVNDSMSDKAALVEALAKEVSLAEGLDFIRAEESLVSGEVRGLIDADGKLVVHTTESRNTTDLRSAVALRSRLLQQESSGLPDRLQLIRDGAHGSYGGWASVTGQEMRYGDSGAHSQNTKIELGFDTSVSEWVLGGSFSYIESDLDDLKAADADGEVYVVSLYGQRNFQSGAYIGGALRYLRADTDYQFENFGANWQQNGWGLALESGHRFAVGDVAFVEPNVSLSYAHFDSDSFRDQNVKGELDSFDAFIGGLGLRAGFNFPNNRGTLYAKVSANHDFCGDVDGRIRSLTGTASSDIGEDLGDTWFEYGVGASFGITSNWYTSVDLTRTTGSEIENNWIANVSVRCVW